MITVHSSLRVTDTFLSRCHYPKPSKILNLSSLFTFALTSGMRPQEYLGLKWADVDLNKGSATVRQAIVGK